MVSPNDSLTEQLCLQCALCCNGVIFADVQIQDRAEADTLQRLGMRFTEKKRGSRKRNPAASTLKLPQPCAALEGCRCRIYSNRPKYCRQFECILFKSVAAGRLQIPAALRIISTARQKAESVRHLLRDLGNNDEQAPLSTRFRQTAGHLEGADLDEATAELYGKLTLAMHELNCLLSEAFYR